MLSWTLYELGMNYFCRVARRLLLVCSPGMDMAGLHPEVVSKLEEELRSVVGDREVLYDDVNQLDYVQMVYCRLRIS